MNEFDRKDSKNAHEMVNDESTRRVRGERIFFLGRLALRREHRRARLGAEGRGRGLGAAARRRATRTNYAVPVVPSIFSQH